MIEQMANGWELCAWRVSNLTGIPPKEIATWLGYSAVALLIFNGLSGSFFLMAGFSLVGRMLSEFHIRDETEPSWFCKQLINGWEVLIRVLNRAGTDRTRYNLISALFDLTTVAIISGLGLASLGYLQMGFSMVCVGLAARLVSELHYNYYMELTGNVPFVRNMNARSVGSICGCDILRGFV